MKTRGAHTFERCCYPKLLNTISKPTQYSSNQCNGLVEKSLFLCNFVAFNCLHTAFRTRQTYSLMQGTIQNHVETKKIMNRQPIFHGRRTVDCIGIPMQKIIFCWSFVLQNNHFPIPSLGIQDFALAFYHRLNYFKQTSLNLKSVAIALTLIILHDC